MWPRSEKLTVDSYVCRKRVEIDNIKDTRKITWVLGEYSCGFHQW